MRNAARCVRRILGRQNGCRHHKTHRRANVFSGHSIGAHARRRTGTKFKNDNFRAVHYDRSRFARIARSSFIKYRNSPLALGEKARGASTLRIMFIHIFPNTLGDLLVTYSLSFASAIMHESGLSYLGLGVQPPAASFGKMLSDAQSSVFQAPWIILVPAIALALLIIGFTLISDGITSQMEGKN